LSAIRLCSGVGVHLPLAAGHGDVYEAAGVSEPLLGAALRGLLLLLRLDLKTNHVSALSSSNMSTKQPVFPPSQLAIALSRDPSEVFVRTLGV
jgi:hypothetical protein